MINKIPFLERKSYLRGLLDLAMGSYPRFVFGGMLGHGIPVFHFHEAHPKSIEPFFLYLAENGYRTIDSSAIAAAVLRDVHPGPNSVALCFDDAWASLWLVVLPLLKKYGLSVIAYVSPARVPTVDLLRQPWNPDQPYLLGPVDRSDIPFCTWPELRALGESGRVDIQAHSWRHIRVACCNQVLDFYAPGKRFHPHEIPYVEDTGGCRLLRPDEYGAPLYLSRSRLSDALRWSDPDGHRACVDYVAEHGGPAFFDRPHWRRELKMCLDRYSRGRFETEEERNESIREELIRSREMLMNNLPGHEIHHMCFPWAVAGKVAIKLAPKLGFMTSFSDRLGGSKIVRPGDPPYRLMRLKHVFIPCLPGTGRQHLFSRRFPPADGGISQLAAEQWSPLVAEKSDNLVEN